MTDITVYYTVNDESFDDYRYIEDSKTYVDNPQWHDVIAQDAAEDYYSEHDGCSYPPYVWENGIRFTLWIKDENDNPVKLGTWNVTMEPRPTFSAWMPE